MEKEEFEQQLGECPLLVRMKDGREYFVEKPEFVIVGDYAAGILFRNQEGKLVNAVASLISISTVLTNVSLNGSA